MSSIEEFYLRGDASERIRRDHEKTKEATMPQISKEEYQEFKEFQKQKQAKEEANKPSFVGAIYSHQEESFIFYPEKGSPYDRPADEFKDFSDWERDAAVQALRSVAKWHHEANERADSPFHIIPEFRGLFDPMRNVRFRVRFEPRQGGCPACALTGICGCVRGNEVWC